MNRIPAYDATNADGMLIWFAEMAQRDLLFHPDDNPQSIVRVKDGAREFAHSESTALRDILASMFAEHGDKVYNSAYPIFARAMRLPLGA